MSKLFALQKKEELEESTLNDLCKTLQKEVENLTVELNQSESAAADIVADIECKLNKQVDEDNMKEVTLYTFEFLFNFFHDVL
jgi:hypothetical protein